MFSNISTLCAAAAGRRSTLFRPRRHRGLASGWLDEKRTCAAAEGQVESGDWLQMARAAHGHSFG
ncbi:hypothetical protein FQK02_16565 [Xanthomonas vasicola]|nr:hypothetical protein FQK02_16565 [Xanthomonas vasicola]